MTSRSIRHLPALAALATAAALLGGCDSGSGEAAAPSVATRHYGQVAFGGAQGSRQRVVLSLVDDYVHAPPAEDPASPPLAP